MIKVKIENFQSIKQAEFVIDGFTVITGDSNIGKSAVVRAINALLSNESGDWFVNNTATTPTFVEIEKDGLKVRWERFKGKASYIINDDQKFEALRGKVPEEVEALGLSGLVLPDDSKQWLNITPSQFETLFLMSDSEASKAATILSNLAHTVEVQLASKECAKELKSTKSLKKIREGDKQVLYLKLDSYKGLEDQVKKFEEVNDSFKQLKKLDKKYKDITKLKGQIDYSNGVINSISDLTISELNIDKISIDFSNYKQLFKLQNHLDNSKKIIGSVEGLYFIDLVESIRELGDSFNNVVKFGNLKNNYLISKQFLDLLKELPEIDVDVKGLEEQYNNYVTIKPLVDKYKKSKQDSDFQVPEVIIDLHNLQDNYKYLVDVKQAVNNYKKALRCVDIPEIDLSGLNQVIIDLDVKYADYNKVKKLCNEYKGTLKSIQDIDKELVDVDRQEDELKKELLNYKNEMLDMEIDTIKKEFHDVLQNREKCPLCLSELVS